MTKSVVSLLLALLLVAAGVYLRFSDAMPSWLFGTRSDGGQEIVTRGDASVFTLTEGDASVLIVTRGSDRAEFAIGPEVDDAFMLFGAQVTDIAEYQDAWLAVLTLPTAAALYRKYPDFYMCKSPGAAEAQGQTQGLDLVTDQAALRERLATVVKEFERNLGRGGPRVCVRVVGKRLTLTSWTRSGQPVLMGGPGPRQIVFVNQVEPADCRALLASARADAGEGIAAPSPTRSRGDPGR